MNMELRFGGTRLILALSYGKICTIFILQKVVGSWEGQDENVQILPMAIII